MTEGTTPERAPHNSAFERQYNSESARKSYDVFGGKIEARILTPENPSDSVPVVLAPGFGETQEVFKKSAEVIFSSGRPVIILDHPRRASTFDKKTLSQIGKENEMPVHELRKAATILNILEEEKIKQVDVIAHSEAAINVALAATLAPDKFRDVVFSNPAGLIGPDKALRLIGRNLRKDARNWLQTIKGNIGVGTEARAFSQGFLYIVKNLNRSLLGEVPEISKAEIEDTLRDLHDQGMGIAVIAGVDDRTFPMNRMQRVSKSDAVPEGFLDGFASVRGGHDDLHAHPDQYTGAALSLLTSLNKKRETQREAAIDAPPTGEWEGLKGLRTKREEKAKRPNIRTRLADKRTISGDYWLKARAESGNYPGLEKNEITDE